MLPWAECEKGASWWGSLCPSSSPLHSLDFDPALFGIDDCSEQIQSPISLSLCVSPSLPTFLPHSFSLSTSQCISFYPWACVYFSPTCSHVSVLSVCPSLVLCCPASLSPSLCLCLSLYVGVSLCLSKSVSTPLPCPSFPSCLPPSFSLPEPLLQLPGVPHSPATLHIFLTLTYYLCCCHFWLWATANRMWESKN